MTVKAKGPFHRLRELRVDHGAIQPTGTPPDTVAGGLGAVPSAKTPRTDPNQPQAIGRTMTKKEAEQFMLAEFLAASRQLVESTTALTAAIDRQGAINGVLDVMLDAIPGTGDVYRVYAYPTTIGMVRITNHHAADALIVQSGTPSGPSAPTSGRGVQKVAAGATVEMPIGTHSVTVWGTAGGQFSLQAYTGLQPWGGNL